MHLLLTDVLACPRCGPEFGLILLADRIDDRRVMEGRLGCANCREQYPVRGGVLDVRTAAGAEDPASPSPEAVPADPEAAMRLAALLGLADARGTVLVAGPGAVLAGGVSDLAEELEVAAMAPVWDGGEERAGVSRISASGGRLPFRDRTLRGVAFTGGADDDLLAEGLRVLQPGARIVVERAAPGTADRLSALGAQVMLDQEGTVVARSAGDPVQLRLNAVR